MRSRLGAVMHPCAAMLLCAAVDASRNDLMNGMNRILHLGAFCIRAVAASPSGAQPRVLGRCRLIQAWRSQREVEERHPQSPGG